MKSSVRGGRIGSSNMYIIEPEYVKKTRTMCTKRSCTLLLFVLLIIAVIVGVIVGITKALQSSESPESNRLEQSMVTERKGTSTGAPVSKASSSMQNISASGTSFPVSTSTVHIASSSKQNISPSGTSYPVSTRTLAKAFSSMKNNPPPGSSYSVSTSTVHIASSSVESIPPPRTSHPVSTSTVATASSSTENISPSQTSVPASTSTEPKVTVTSWSTWQAWSGCSTSCGGGIQTRRRTCGKANIPNVIPNCYGNNVLYRNCSTWKCPDCSKLCPTGYLNSACDACVCTNVTVTGMVKNEEGTLLNNATVALSEFPFNVLARTNVAGHFEMRGICVEQEEIIVERSGYIPKLLKAQKIDSTSFKISARLEATVFPQVTVHPESKIRIEDQTGIFCCAGTGKPTPKYEWIMNGRSVSEYQQDQDDSSKLAIPRLHRNMTGEVKCRVYNDYGAEFSSVARITVITKTDSCNDTPLRRTVTLPPGCVEEETNSSVVEAGRCVDDICFANHLMSENCSDNYCCQPIAEKNIVIRCLAGSFSYNMTRVTSCGCGRCLPKISIVTGAATGGPNNTPFKYGYIYNSGKYLTQAGENGEFSFTMPSDITRVVLNFKGKDGYNDFQDLTKVVPVVPGRETFVEVRLKPRPEPMLVNASETIEIPMGSDGQSAPVVLSLPPYSLITEDGEVYNGTAKVEVSFADPRNATQVREADGDFTAISEDGDQQLLDTFGVLKIDFTDSNGKQLQTKEDIDVLLDLDEYDITEKVAKDIKLWYMDEKTGRWRLMDPGLKQHESRRSKRSGRKFYFGKIDHTLYNYVYNLDKPREERCLVKIKINDNAANFQSVEITVTTVEGNLNRYLVHSLLTGISSCVEIFCKNITIRAKIDNNNVLHPNDSLDDVLKSTHGIAYYDSRIDNAVNRFGNRITIQDIISNTTIKGPFFKDWNICRIPQENNSLLFDVPNQNESSGSISQDLKWHQSLDPEKGVCFLKITTGDSCRYTWNVVTFHVKITDVLEKSEEGFTLVSTSPSNPSTCAEFKCPSTNERSLLVTVTPIATGNFSATQLFVLSHKLDGYKVFVGHTVEFRPRHELNDYAIGVIWVNALKETSPHKKARNNCEKSTTTAGLRFDCT